MWSKGSEGNNKLVQDFFLTAFQWEQFIDTNHESTDTCVIRELFNISCNFLNEFMQGFQFFFSGRFIRYQIVVVTVVEQWPELLDETVYTVDTVRIPGFWLFYRTQEHFVHTKCVGTIFFYDHIGIDHIEHRFTHLFDCPTTDIFAIFQDKLSRGVFWSPCFECFDIQNIIGYDIYIHMEWGSVIIVFQVQRNKRIGIFDAVYKITSSLNHTLIY